MKKMKWSKRIFIAAGIGLALVSAVLLDRLTNIDRKKDPLDQKVMEEKDIYREQGWSELVISENEDRVIYEDRERERFSAGDVRERASYFTDIWNHMCQYLPNTIEKYVIPVPAPIMYEAGYEEDRDAYQEYLRLLREGLNSDTKLGDISERLAGHIEEGCFYRYSNSLSNRGGYYAAEALLEMTGEEPLPALTEYREELYPASDEGDVFDYTYLYTLPGSKNYCEVFRKDDEGQIHSRKYPVISRREKQSGSVVTGESYEWIVIEGDEEEESVLLIADDSGKAMAPYLANRCHKVILVDLEWGRAFGTGEYSVENFLRQYHITKVVCAQNASKMGLAGNSRVLNKFVKEDGEMYD